METHEGASELDGALIAKYRAAHYRVDAEPPFVMRIDEKSSRLADLYGSAGVDCAAFVTACNPLGRSLDAETNRQAQQALQWELESAGFRWLHGKGEDPTGQWPGEESVLILGISREEGKRLGQRFRQNAIVWVGRDAVPELVLLR